LAAKTGVKVVRRARMERVGVRGMGPSVEDDRESGTAG